MTAAIRVENVSKCYRLYKANEQIPSASLREELGRLARWSSRWFRREATDAPEEFWALKDVSFEVAPGEVLGIVGRNGAGKSTMLKILSRITKPTSGRVRLRGRLGSLLEVGTGFHPELTGRENIFLNGAILGMRRAEIQRHFHDIVGFAGVEAFLDMPVKRYSSGMYTRLAFAVAAHFNPEILIIDEVLAVGDAEFQKRCLGRMSEVARQGRTVVFVSHNMAAVHRLCNSGVLLEGGRVKVRGTADEVVEAYLNHGRNNLAFRLLGPRESEAFFTSLLIHGTDGGPKRAFGFDEPIGVLMTLSVKASIPGMHVTLAVRNSWGQKICHSSNHYAAQPVVVEEAGEYSLRAIIPANYLLPGSYSINAAINLPNHREFDFREDVMTFDVTTAGWGRTDYAPQDLGCVSIPVGWERVPVDIAEALAVCAGNGA
jgi:lipopolysaccharide transport system ATP-binding protein